MSTGMPMGTEHPAGFVQGWQWHPLCCSAAVLRNGCVGKQRQTLSSKDHLSPDKDNGLKAKKRGFDWSRKSCTRH